MNKNLFMSLVALFVMALATQSFAGKVSDMTEATSVATNDLATVVDVSDTTMAASGTNKKIQTANLLKYITRLIQLSVCPDDALLAVGDSSIAYRVPSSLNGASLISVGACVGTTYSSSGTPTFKIEKQHLSAPGTRDAVVQMLSTNITIDASEYDSSNAATAAVIKSDGSEVVATGDIIIASCVTSAGTGTKGGSVTLEFRLN